MRYIAGNLSHTTTDDKSFNVTYYKGKNTFNDFGDSVFNLAADLCP